MPDNPKIIVFGGPNLVDEVVQYIHGCELLFSPAISLGPSSVTDGKATWRLREDPVEYRTGKIHPRFDNANTRELLQQLCEADSKGLRHRLFKHYMEGCEWKRQPVSFPDIEVVVFDCRMIVADLRAVFAELSDEDDAPSAEPSDNVDTILIPRNRGVLKVRDVAGHWSTMSMTEYDNPLYNWLSTLLDSALQPVQILIATDPDAPELSEWLVEMCHAIAYPECRNPDRAAMYVFGDDEGAPQPPPQLANPEPVRGDIRMVTGTDSVNGLSFGGPIKGQDVLYFSRESLDDFVYRSQRGISMADYRQQEDQQANFNANTRGAGPFQTFCEAGYFPLAVHTGGTVCAFRFDEIDRATIYAMPRSFLLPEFRSKHWPPKLSEELGAIPERDILHSGFTWADVTLKFTLKQRFSASVDIEPWELQRLEVVCGDKSFEADMGDFIVGSGGRGASRRLKKRFPALIRYYAGLPSAGVSAGDSIDVNFRRSVSDLREAIANIHLPMTVLGSPLPTWSRPPDLKVEVTETP